MLPFQFGINAQLAHWLGSPVRAAFVSFLVGTIALLVISAFVRKPLPSTARLGDVPWWVWIGGLLGAFYVAGSIVTAPKLGAVDADRRDRRRPVARVDLRRPVRLGRFRGAAT